MRIVLCDVCHAFAALSDELFQKEVISGCLHVVAIGFNETFDLVGIEVSLLALLEGKLSDDVLVNGYRVQADDYTPVVLHIDLSVPFMAPYIIDFDSCEGICVENLGHEVAA
jgi:hypothetical protein